MATDVITVIMTAVQSVFIGLGDSLQSLWNSLIYTRDAGVDEILYTADDITELTPFAEWMLVFVGFSIGIGILYSVLRKVI